MKGFAVVFTQQPLGLPWAEEQAAGQLVQGQMLILVREVFLNQQRLLINLQRPGGLLPPVMLLRVIPDHGNQNL